MNTTTETTMTTELTVIDRATAVLKFDETKAALLPLVEASARIVNITNGAGYAEAQSARMKLKNTRVEIEGRGMNTYAFELTAKSGTIYPVDNVTADNLAGALKIAERHAACGPAKTIKVQSAALGDMRWTPYDVARKLERIQGVKR